MSEKESAALRSILQKINKKYGTNTVLKMDSASVDVETIPSGRAELDEALGGGWAKGKIIEIYSDYGCGKTGLALDTVAAVQRVGGRVAIVDSEHALNTEYCKLTGVKVEDIYFSQPDYGEQGCEIVRALVSSGEFDLIVLDSIAALTPRAIIEGETGQAHMASHARMIGQFMAQIKGPLNEMECTLICINQIRGTLAMYGSPTTTPGGKALKFYSSQRVEIKRKGDIKAGDEKIGFKQLITITKNKISPPFKTVLSDIIFNKGVDTLGDLIDSCVYEGIIEKTGAFYKFHPEQPKVRGMKSLRNKLEENLEFVDYLKNEINGRL